MFISYSKFIVNQFASISHNVPAVNDGFLCAIEELRSNSSAQKNVAPQNTAKAKPERCFVEPSRRQAAYFYRFVICRLPIYNNFLFLCLCHIY